MLRNCKEWVWFDQAALALGLVTVPLYVDDRPDNIAYCLNDSGARLLVVEGEDHLRRLAEVRGRIPGVSRIVAVRAVGSAGDDGVRTLSEWLPASPATAVVEVDPRSLATIVYTSGTTGRPKGVMLSHRNVLQNVVSGLAGIDVFTDDVFLSFLPLSHMFERTVGYYLTMVAGSEVAFARSIPKLAEDFRSVRPTVIVSVPRIYERLHAAIQGQLRESPGVKRRLVRGGPRRRLERSSNGGRAAGPGSHRSCCGRSCGRSWRRSSSPAWAAGCGSPSAAARR